MALIEPAPSLREQVASWLRGALFVGDLPPGTTFSVPALAEQFGVSATPVREAVLDLAHRGLVVAVPTRGFRVVEPTRESITHGIEVRRLLEVPTTCRIAASITTEQLAALRTAARVILDHARAKNLRGFVEVDYRFHHQLTGLCGNPLLIELIEDIRARARVHAIPYMAQTDITVAVAQEHLELLDAMEDRDLDRVAEVTERHMGSALAALEWFEHHPRREPHSAE